MSVIYMSGLTGYISASGIDLSYIFQAGTTTTQSGYKLQNGNDLSSLFDSNAGLVYAPKTGYSWGGGGFINII